MAALAEVDPGEVGLDADRLARIPEFFARYVDAGRIPMAATLVARGGRVAHFSCVGGFELGAAARPIDPSTIFRIYSMTKPITSVAFMMLFEAGLVRLDEPLSRYIPGFADVKVFDGGTAPAFKAPARAITMLDLMRHTSGLTYAFLHQNEVDALYRERKLDAFTSDRDLEALCDGLAAAPLVFSPGDRWNYSSATDVVGRVIEIVSGERLDDFFRKRIFEPLGMRDTGFWADGERIDRLPACYHRDPQSGALTLVDPAGAGSRAFAAAPKLLSGGGGLISTLGDYFRFCMMLRNRGTLGEAQLLSRKTVDFMTQNHLPDGRTIRQMGDRTFSETRMDGSGFGLGFAVTVDPVATMMPGSVGAYSWGGFASTFFWIDPVEDLIVIQATQIMPSSAYPIRPQLQQLVYAALRG